MIGLRHVLAPPPVWLTPSGVAVASVATFTAAATPIVVGAIPDVVREIDVSHGGYVACLIFIATVTATFAAALASAALRASTSLRARLRLSLGGAGAGALATATSFVGVRILLGRTPLFPAHVLEGILLGSPILGGSLGFLFGTAFAPVVTSAMGVRERPSHDGLDRVLFAAGATLLAPAAGRAAFGAPLVGAWAGVAAGLLGAILCVLGAARILVRVRLLARVRDGSLPGFHVVPRSGREDEEPLVPLLRSTLPPAGVLAATGVSAPYRGARGIFKLALAPLPDEPAGRPLASLLWAVIAPLSDTVVTLLVGAAALVVLSPVLLLVMVATW